jgi:hypothetical protein
MGTLAGTTGKGVWIVKWDDKDEGKFLSQQPQEYIIPLADLDDESDESDDSDPESDDEFDKKSPNDRDKEFKGQET